MISYFLRYTRSPKKDLIKNISYHYSDYKKGTLDWLEEGESEKEFVAERFGCDVEDIKVDEDGYYVQKLEGLCGFELEAEDLEEAIEEAEEFYFNSVYNSKDMTEWAIYEGKYLGDCIEGEAFDAYDIVYVNK